jgi:hypothetical protein
MRIGRRILCSAAMLGLWLSACGGESSRLVTVRTGTGSGPIQFEVKNNTDVAINSLFMARHEDVKMEYAQSSPQAQRVWGGDLIDHAIPTGTRVPIPVPGPGRWDVKATDADGRYQHIAAVKLDAGGRYILELYDRNWRVDY